jgi:dethiobiotin synthetase
MTLLHIVQDNTSNLLTFYKYIKLNLNIQKTRHVKFKMQAAPAASMALQNASVKLSKTKMSGAWHELNMSSDLIFFFKKQ